MIVGVAVYRMDFASVPVAPQACAARILCDCPAACSKYEQLFRQICSVAKNRIIILGGIDNV